MYVEHFGLREAPFRITPHTDFFFPGAGRWALLEALIYALTHDDGIVKVSGDVGSGKTMLCRMLRERLPKDIHTIYLSDPSLSREEMLYAITEALGVSTLHQHNHFLRRALEERLVEIHTKGQRVIVMVDEAHALSSEALEEIRRLSNLETEHHKLLHIILFGQPELDLKLIEPSMRLLKERITHNFALEPLNLEETLHYLSFRMRSAGYLSTEAFSPRAVKLIHLASRGLTRRIHILADKSLAKACAENKPLVERKHVLSAIEDAQFYPIPTEGYRHRKKIAQAAACATIVLAILALSYWNTSPTTGEHALKIVTNASANTQAAPQPLAEPLSKKDPSTPLASAKAVPSSAQSPAPVLQRGAPPAPTLGAPPPPLASLPPLSPPSALSPPSPLTALSPTALAPTASNTRAPEALPIAELSPPVFNIDARLANTASWLASVPETHYFIQLLHIDASNAKGLQAFIARLPKHFDPQQVRVYRSNLSGKDRFGVIYGDYPSPESAEAALRQLMRQQTGLSAYVRSVTKLR